MKDFSMKKAESGNAMIYVLIVVALFAALSFVMARNSGSGEQGTLDTQRINVYASQIVQMSNQVKQGVDQVLYSGSAISNLNFCLPGEVCFTSAPLFNNVFHPEGGGMIRPVLQAETIHAVDNDPDPGWYVGRFNDVKWTPLGPLGRHDCPVAPPDCDVAGKPDCNDICPPGCPSSDPAICPPHQDVILTAHQIREDVCARINELLTGLPAIPALTVEINKVLIDAARHSNGPNDDLTAVNCPDPDAGGPLEGCEGKAALCVVNAAGTIWSYYSIIEQQ